MIVKLLRTAAVLLGLAFIALPLLTGYTISAILPILIGSGLAYAGITGRGELFDTVESNLARIRQHAEAYHSGSLSSSFEDFRYFMSIATAEDAQRIANAADLTVQGVAGRFVFRDGEREVEYEEVWASTQNMPAARRELYLLRSAYDRL